MTSNLGSDEIQKAFENNQSFKKAEELATLNVMELLKKNIRPGFLNRIDAKSYFLLRLLGMKLKKL